MNAPFFPTPRVRQYDDAITEMLLAKSRKCGMLQGSIQSALIELKYGNSEGAADCLRRALEDCTDV